jgi:hypothetical protein
LCCAQLHCKKLGLEEKQKPSFLYGDDPVSKTLLKSTHLGEWVIKVYIPKSMNTSIGCIYNVPLNITEDEIKDVLKQQKLATV